jgi:hypothetical protein
LIVSLLLAALAAAGAAFLKMATEGGDGWWELARNIYYSGSYTFVKGGAFTTFRPPLYPVLLVAALATPAPLYTLALIQAVLFAASGLALYEAGTTLSGRPAAGLICWFLWLIYPYSYFHLFYVKINLIETFLISFILWWFIRVITQPGTREWIILGVWGGLGALTYSMVLVLYTLLLGCALLYHKAWRSQAWRQGLMAIMTTFFIYLPWGGYVFWNSHGTAFFSSDPIGFNYFVGNEYSRKSEFGIYRPAPLGSPAVLDIIESAGGEPRQPYWKWESAVYARLNRMAIQHALSHPLHLLRKLVIQAPMTWYVSQKQHLLVQIAAVWTLVYFLAALFIIITSPAVIRIAVGLSVMAITILYALTYAYVRYAQPFVPLLCLIIADWIYEHLSPGQPAD